MKTIGAIVGGAVGGLIGAVVWALVTYYSGYEIGWIAWGIGGLVGLGVHLGTRGSGGIAHGGTAAIIALAAVLGGKWAAVRIELSAFLKSDEAPTAVIADLVIAEREAAGRPVQMPPEEAAETLAETYPPAVWQEAVRRWESLDPDQREAARELPPLANPDVWLVWMADVVVEDFQRDGRDVTWPPGMAAETAWAEADYPADVWAEAVRRWDTMSEAERERFKADVIRDVREGMAADEQAMLTGGFIQSFSLFDILWAGLAVVTAAKLGAGASQTEPAQVR